jgi:hypothetical protein
VYEVNELDVVGLDSRQEKVSSQALETGAFSELLKQPLFDLVKVGFGNATGV